MWHPYDGETTGERPQPLLSDGGLDQQERADLAYLRRVVALATRANGGQLTLAANHNIGLCHLVTSHHHDPGGDGRCYDTIDFHDGRPEHCLLCLEHPPPTSALVGVSQCPDRGQPGAG